MPNGWCGVAYSDAVRATGAPAPTISLMTNPAGMTIHPNSGRIEWTPPSAGNFNVAEKVSSTQGRDTHSFKLVVN